MNSEIIATVNFEREAKKLKKKYPSLKEELRTLFAQLRENPTKGDRLKENTYKVRLGVKSKGRGKSGGLRVITHVLEVELAVEKEELPTEALTRIFLLSIYSKSENPTISDKKLRGLIENLQDEPEDEEGDE